MMLWYKAWRESRGRFLISAGVVIAGCLSVLWRARSEFPVVQYPGVTYPGFVWANLYGGAAPFIFTMVAVVLGLGGLQRERADHTAPFTLSLPISRQQLVITRALVGLAEVLVLALIPVLLLPALSPVVARNSYPTAEALRFALLFVSWSAVWFSAGVLWSTALRNQYAAVAACVLTPVFYMTIYSLVSNGGSRLRAANPFAFMSGIEHLKPNTGVFIEPLPWGPVVALAILTAAIVGTATQVARRLEF